MVVGFRGRQIAALTVTAATVALATGLISAVILVRTQVLDARDRGELWAKTFYHLVSQTIRQRGQEDLRTVLARDPALHQYADAVVGYSSMVLYMAIVDEDGIAILHSDPRQEGRPVTKFESLEQFSGRNPFSQIWVLSQENRVLVVDLPFSADGVRPFGSVVVAASTILLQKKLFGLVATHALIAGTVAVVAFLVSFLIANRLLAPLERLRMELARIDPGDGQPRLDLRTEADVERLVEFFSSMSQRLTLARPEKDDRSWVRTMLDGLSDAVIVVNQNRRILSLNDDACRMLGGSRDELEGAPVDRVLAPGHPLRSLVDESLEDDAAVRSRTTSFSAQGREVPYLIAAHVLHEAGRVSGVMVTARDLQRLSKLGAQLSYSQKLAALGRLTAGVAHEIRNPLNALVMQVALLRRKLAEGETDATRHLDILEKEMNRLNRVIEGFLQFTRPEEIHLESVRLENLVQEVVEVMAARAEKDGIRLEWTVPSELPAVSGSAGLLRQVLLNLVGNACDAMPNGGEVRVRAARSTDGSILLSVEDTGDGISAEELPRIFDLFYTTKSAGSGIGLSMVYRIIQLHGGEIRVDSERGTGTRVTMTLPEVVV